MIEGKHACKQCFSFLHVQEIWLRNDFQAWVRQTEHELAHHEAENSVYKFLEKKV